MTSCLRHNCYPTHHSVTPFARGNNLDSSWLVLMQLPVRENKNILKAYIHICICMCLCKITFIHTKPQYIRSRYVLKKWKILVKNTRKFYKSVKRNYISYSRHFQLNNFQFSSLFSIFCLFTYHFYSHPASYPLLFWVWFTQSISVILGKSVIFGTFQYMSLRNNFNKKSKLHFWILVS